MARHDQERWLREATDELAPDLYSLYADLHRRIEGEDPPDDVDDAEWYTDENFGYIFLAGGEISVETSLVDADATEGGRGGAISVEADLPGPGGAIGHWMPENYTTRVWTTDVDELRARIASLRGAAPDIAERVKAEIRGSYGAREAAARQIDEGAFEEFMRLYEQNLRDAVLSHPDEYGWPIEDLPAVVGRMGAAVRRGSYNKDGRAFRDTARQLGIPHTYKAINAFLAGGPR